MSEHTKEPWELEHQPERQCDGTPDHHRIIGQVMGYRTGVVADTLNRDHVIDPEEDAANARLLLAAPALFAVAKELVWRFPDLAEILGGSQGRRAAELIVMARAAIAKAEGKP
jgi:hypothetical protein